MGRNLRKLVVSAVLVPFGLPVITFGQELTYQQPSLEIPTRIASVQELDDSPNNVDDPFFVITRSPIPEGYDQTDAGELESQSILEDSIVRPNDVPELPPVGSELETEDITEFRSLPSLPEEDETLPISITDPRDNWESQDLAPPYAPKDGPVRAKIATPAADELKVDQEPTNRLRAPESNEIPSLPTQAEQTAPAELPPNLKQLDGQLYVPGQGNPAPGTVQQDPPAVGWESEVNEYQFDPVNDKEIQRFTNQYQANPTSTPPDQATTESGSTNQFNQFVEDQTIVGAPQYSRPPVFTDRVSNTVNRAGNAVINQTQRVKNRLVGNRLPGEVEVSTAPGSLPFTSPGLAASPSSSQSQDFGSTSVVGAPSNGSHGFSPVQRSAQTAVSATKNAAAATTQLATNVGTKAIRGVGAGVSSVGAAVQGVGKTVRGKVGGVTRGIKTCLGQSLNGVKTWIFGQGPMYDPSPLRFKIGADALYLRHQGADDAPFVFDANTGDVLFRHSDINPGGDTTAQVRLMYQNMTGTGYEFSFFNLDATGTTEFEDGIPQFFGGVPADLADSYTSTYQSALRNYEFNMYERRSDRFRFGAGLRHIDLREDFNTVESGTTDGFFSQTDNELWGAQFGGDFYHPISDRIMMETGIYFGSFYNRVEVGFQSATRDLNFDESFASTNLDLTIGLSYRMGAHSYLRAGYQGMFLGRVALGPNQSTGFTFGDTSAPIKLEDVHYHGAYFGGTLLF